MKIFFLTLIKFTVFVTIFYVVFISICGWIFPDFLKRNLLSATTDIGYTSRRIAEMKTAGVVDILFLGSSRSYRGFDIRIFRQAGYTSFNLGTSNQTPDQSYYLLKKYLPKLLPKTVIFEVNPDIFSGDGVESAVDIISHSTPHLDLLHLIWASKNIKAINGFIFTCLRYMFISDEIETLASDSLHYQYIPGGYVATRNSAYNSKLGNIYNCNLNDDQLKAFENIINLLAAKGIKTLLVQAPVVKKLYESCHENERFDRFMRSHGVYYNFNLSSVSSVAEHKEVSKTVNQSIKLTDTMYFIDGQHLNQKGVQKFNELILMRLRELDQKKAAGHNNIK